jgi:hypothetical protein
LGLSAEAVDGRLLGAIDTFRFEEAAVVSACFDLIAGEKFSEAGSLMASREESLWVNLDADRKTVWAVCRLMVDLGLVAASACETIAKSKGKLANRRDYSRLAHGSSDGHATGRVTMTTSLCKRAGASLSVIFIYRRKEFVGSNSVLNEL